MVPPFRITPAFAQKLTLEKNGSGIHSNRWSYDTIIKIIKS